MAELPEEIPTDPVVEPEEAAASSTEWSEASVNPTPWLLVSPVTDPRAGDIIDGEPVIPPPPIPPPVDPDPPAAPSDLVATSNGVSQIDLTWVRQSTDESSFRIERSLSSGTNFGEIATVLGGTLAFSDLLLAEGTQFFYRVIAVNSGGDSPPSNEANATTDVAAAAPIAPSDLTAETTAPGTVTLVWTDNSSDEDFFRIERSLSMTSGFAEIATVGPGIETFKDEAAFPVETQFFYQVRASNAAGFSAYTNVASGGGVFYPNGFANRYAIKLRPNQVTDVLANYPIRIEIQFDALKLETVDPINGKTRNASGFDIIFEELTGVKMAFDRRAYDGTLGRIEVWIETAQLFAEHAFFMFIGNSAIVSDQQDKVAMWSNVATMALDCLNGVDFSGKQVVTVVNAASADTLLGAAGQGDGTTTFTVPMDTLFAGDIEQSSMCWIRANAVGTDEGWVESLAPGAYPDGGETFAAWLMRYDASGSIGGSVDLIKYGVEGENFETSSNRQTLNDQFFAMTWAGGQFPKLYIDGGSAQFQDASSGLPGPALLGDPGDVLEFYNGLANWQGVFDEYIQFDRELSLDFTQTAYKNQVNTTNFLAIDPTEGVVPEPGFVPDPPAQQPTTSWEAFFDDRVVPTIPTEDSEVTVSTFSALTAAITAAAADSGQTTKIRLTADLTGFGSQQPAYNIVPNTTVIVDFDGFEINNSNSTVRMTYDGFFSDWNVGDDNSRVTGVSTTADKTTVSFLNLPTGLAEGDWLKVFAPRIDSTIDFRLGSEIWGRTPQSVRIGQAYQVELITGNDVLLNDYIRDAIGGYNETALSGRLWGAKYLCTGVSGQGSVFLVDNKFRNTGVSNNIAILGLAHAHVIRPYIENNVSTTGFPHKISLGGVRGKIYDPFFDSQLDDNSMGSCYAMNFLPGGSQNVMCNTDNFSRPYNMRQFRNYGDSGSPTLSTGDNDRQKALRTGQTALWGVHRGIVQDTGGSIKYSGHHLSVGIHYKGVQSTNSPGFTNNIFMGMRAASGEKFTENVIEGLVLLDTDSFNDAIFQFYNESAQNFYNGDPKGGNSQGEDNATFGILLRNNIIHHTGSAQFYFLSGGWRGPIKFGTGNEIHFKTGSGGEPFKFESGFSTAKNRSDVLPDPEPGWDVSGDSTYFMYNATNSRLCRMGNGAISNWDSPIIDLSNRFVGSVTLADLTSSATLTGIAQIKNPNGLSVTPATGSGDFSGFSIVSI